MCDCTGMEFLANRWVFTGRCRHDAPRPLDKVACPVCKVTPETARLSYRSNVQRTKCPNGHPIHREWNGPENQFYDRNQPYGWTEWKETAS